MNSATDAATFLRKLEKFIPLFEGGDPDPLSFRQKRQFHAWKALLDSNPTSGNSKSRVHARKKARNFALKVIDTAGRETLLLCILVYSISGLPKITFQRFYLELKKWSQRACFPELLVEQASKLWNQSDQRGSQQRESSSQQRQLETENTQPGQTIVEAAIPSMSCKAPGQEKIGIRTNHLSKPR
ncbi:hypothetical protein PRK78_005562 [Emydomyces testavorans]|uniref:Uncharacterized protein n=1 Tax=Emydomyces testavorans TaxID=2070801 RepID=A0AAF0DKG5_9EURO|nr:hypothetical protein PRK78_005562 [Emydomyces testavorans]